MTRPICLPRRTPYPLKYPFLASSALLPHGSPVRSMSSGSKPRLWSSSAAPDHLEWESRGSSFPRVEERVVNIPDAVNDAVGIYMTVSEDVDDRFQPSELLVEPRAAGYFGKVFEPQLLSGRQQVPPRQEV